VKLSLRAAASKALSALSGGKWRGIACFLEKIWGRLENRCFADKPFPALLVQLPAARMHSHKMEHPDVAVLKPRLVRSREKTGRNTLSKLVHTLEIWFIRRHRRQELSLLDDGQLKDVGISRENVRRGGRQAFLETTSGVPSGSLAGSGVIKISNDHRKNDTLPLGPPWRDVTGLRHAKRSRVLNAATRFLRTFPSQALL
jgi:uncharacterized protein YjiS (DUF1127 family)